MLVTYARQDDPRFLHRADPAYWHPAYDALWATCGWPRQPLGDFITHIAYGPIITRQQPPAVDGRIALVNQGQIGYAGVDLGRALRIPEECPWDRPSARVRPGDLVIARSGEGSVARNRLALYAEDEPAVVGSFVDVVRLEGVEPAYVALFLKTRYGWGQIHRLVNGVATPNLSFGEIRSLELALPPPERQRAWRDAYFTDVYPLHRAGSPVAEEAHRRLVTAVEQFLSSRSTQPC